MLFNDDVHIMPKIVPDYYVLMLCDKIRKNMEITRGVANRES